MGLPKEDLESAIVYPLGSVIFYIFVWKLIISRLSCCLLGLPDKVINAAIISLVHVMSLQRMSPHKGEFVTTPWHVEIALLLCASYYLMIAFDSDSKWDIAFNLMIVLSILDFITLKRGGDLAIYYLFLLETPDFAALYMGPVLRSEACFEIIYSMIYVGVRIVLLAHITYVVIMNKEISEDIKMNLSILYIFSCMCIPSMLLSCYQCCSGSVKELIECLPQVPRCRQAIVEPASSSCKKGRSNCRR